MDDYRPLRLALLLVTAAMPLVGGGLWWSEAAPVRAAGRVASDEPSPFVTVVVLNRSNGQVIYDERRPAGPLEWAVSWELPCGAFPRQQLTFSLRLWAAHQATATGTLCSYVHYRAQPE